MLTSVLSCDHVTLRDELVAAYVSDFGLEVGASPNVASFVQARQLSQASNFHEPTTCAIHSLKRQAPELELQLDCCGFIIPAAGGSSHASKRGTMSGSGYDAVVDIDDEVRPFPLPPIRYPPLTPQIQGDLGHTDLQEDLEFHNSNFSETTPALGKRGGGGGAGASSGLPLPATTSTSSSGGGSKRFLWTLSFYAQFFDVDTSSVLARCWAALFPRDSFLDVLEGNPDLYGPFWIATTVVLILFLGGTISAYRASTGDGAFAYDFRLLSGRLIPLVPWFGGG